MIYSHLGKIIRIVVLFSLLHQCNFSLSQVEIRTNPFIDNFLKEEYLGGVQTWDSDLMDNGHIFFANDRGVLHFDGLRWKNHPLPNKTIVRSICTTKDRIYVGGQDELGYLSPAPNGLLTYHSIREMVPEIYLPFQDVWDLTEFEGKIYMRSINRVYVFDPNTNSFEVIEPGGTLTSIFVLNNTMHYVSNEKEVASLTGVSELSQSIPNNLQVIDAVQTKESILVFTAKNGLYRLKDGLFESVRNSTSEYLKENNIYVVTEINNNLIGIGTPYGGVVIIDNQCNTIKKIDKNDGLTINNVHSVSHDKNGSLWIGTSNGINRILSESPVEILPAQSTGIGTFYDVKYHNQRLYFSTNNALFSTKMTARTSQFDDLTYDRIPNTEGQAWGLDIIDGDLMMGHNNGLYQVQNGSVKLISKKSGVWKFLNARNEKEMYVGTYDGVDVYEKRNGQWTFLKKLEGFIESSRIMISVKKNELWVSHPYRGVYRIVHDDDYFVTNVTLYDERFGLPSTLSNYIFEIDNTPYVTANTGVYAYDRINDRFVLDQKMNDAITSSENVRRLFEEKRGKIWFLTESEAGYISRNNDGTYSKIKYPNLADKFVNGFENMYFINDNQAFICGVDEMLSLDLNQKIDLSRPETHITEVKMVVDKDSLLYGGFSTSKDSLSNHQSTTQLLELKHTQNALVFSFSSPSHSRGIQYSYLLTETKDSDNDELNWSNWSDQTVKEYNNLSPGEYVFMVRSQSENGVTGTPSKYTFEIKPPWYYSTMALAGYWIFCFGALAALIFVPRTKYKKKTKILTNEKEASEAKLKEIKTEKLQAEIDFKNSELASSTMHLVQKNETINKIRQELQNVSKKIKDNEAKKEIRKILSVLSDDERLEDEWENFSRHFDNVHTDFIQRISTSFPQLTPKDKKMCAYLRMNLTTKEIAPLLNISVRGVEISRYRLRKKLELPGNTNLNDFMMTF